LSDEILAYSAFSKEEQHLAGPPMDTKDYGIGSQILRDLGVKRMNLLSNTPNRRKGVTVYGLTIEDTISLS